MSCSPQLHHVLCPTPPAAKPRLPAGGAVAQRRMAYWNWPAATEAGARHAVVCVHGLSRQGRDFDVLARALQPRMRVVCPDVAGRGHSDWLADPMGYQVPTYVADMMALLAQLRGEGVQVVDWVGSSMGGLIGMALAAQPALGVRRLVLNDVGPVIQAEALLRIGTYLGADPHFPALDAAVDYLRGISVGFGPHTPQQWAALSEPMLVPHTERGGVGGGYRLHYDPAIVIPFKALTAELASAAAQQGEALLWQMYDQITATTLVLRGAESDLLTASTALEMTERGPRARVETFAGVGHAPTLVEAQQVRTVCEFLKDACDAV